MKQFTYDEVEKTKDGPNNIFAINDLVYDVTSFLNEHPGGEEVMIDRKGEDITEDFTEVGHSFDALELMKKFQIGEIVESERRNVAPKDGWKAGGERPVEIVVVDPSTMYMCLVGAGIAISILAYFMFM